MIRPLPRLARPALFRGILGAVALAALAACAGGGRDPAISSVTIPSAPPGAPPLPTRSGQVYAAPAPAQGVRDRAALAAACRQDAERIILFRDRGQLMREDERDARIGSDASIYARRVETDRLGRQFERDRLADQCVQENTRAAPQR